MFYEAVVAVLYWGTVGLAVLFTAVCLYLAKVHNDYKHIPGPPLRSFFFGNVHDIREYIKRGDFTHMIFLRWAEEYGDVYKVFILHKCLVMLSGQNVVKEVLTHSRYPKSPMTYGPLFSLCGRRFLGRGLVSDMDHQRWARRRAVINPAFHNKLLRPLMGEFNSTADSWLEKLSSFADGTTEMNLADSLAKVTLDVIGRVGLGVDFQALDDDKLSYSKALTSIVEAMSLQMRDPMLQIRPSRKKFVQEVRRSVEMFRSEGQKVIEQRSRELQTNEPVPSNLLTFIAKCAESCPDLTIEDALDDFCTLLIAGQDTTANTLSFLFKEVGRHPEVKHKLMEEITSVLGDQSDVTFEDLSRLEYMDQVIRETLRMYPIAGGTMRDSVPGTVLNGYAMPYKAKLTISFYVLHRLHKNFPNPDEFVPERFSSQATRKLYTYMPFSLGQRSCAGRQFALIEAKVLLCKFFRQFDYELVPDQPMGIQEMSTLHPKGGTLVTLSPRKT